FYLCFFFQAEDGIRDLTVTGVQTCALPICTLFPEGFVAPTAHCVATTNPSGNKVPTAGSNPKSGQNPDGFFQLVASDNCGDDDRSEERRVGKECRRRWATGE